MAYKNTIINPPNISSQASVQKSQFYKGFSTVESDSLGTKLFDFDLIKQDILNGETFENKAIIYSDDPGSAANGGLYTNIGRGKMVKIF